MVKLSDIELPMFFRDRLLFSSGFHNDLNIAPEEILKSFNLTDWNDQRNRSLFLSHSERDAESWLGRIINPYMKNGELFGDLEVHDANLAMKLGPGRAPIGVSAEIRWPPQFSDPINFTYRGFAMVPNPEVPDTMINFSKQEKDGFNTANIIIPFKEDIQNKADFSDGVVTSESARGSPVGEIKEEVEEETKADFSEEKESNLMSAERGFNEEKMENTEKIVEEVKEEEVVETVEETTEAKEAPETEEVKEEAKADFSAINDKLDVLSERMTKMEANYAKFSEAEEAEEEVEETVPAEETTEEVAEVEEVKEEVVEEEKVEEVAEAPEEAKAEFSELANKLDKLADAIAKKDAAPMSTAEFGTQGLNEGNAVIDRLTESLSN